MNLRIVLIYLLCLATTASGFKIIGYYTNWNPSFPPSKVNYSKLTHIQYAFLEVATDGQVKLSDANNDEKLLLGKIVSSSPVIIRDTNNALIPLAHKAGTKVLASIGGFDGSMNFSDAASTAETRARFASSSKQLINRYGFDGIDIDWEYPAMAEHNGKPEDRNNLCSLIVAIRDTFNTIPGERKSISLAIAGSEYYGKDYLVEKFINNVDFVSIMTYDYAGTWMDKSWFNSPLYSYGSADNYSLHQAMQYYRNRNISPDKLTIGVAFYGRTFTGCQKPNSAFTGEGSGEPGQKGYIFYPTIMNKITNGTYVRYWDDSAKVPYALSQDEFCTYDDTVSIRLKGEYCKKNSYAGAIIWELSAGVLSDDSQPLLDALYLSLNGSSPVLSGIKPNLPISIKFLNKSILLYGNSSYLKSVNVRISDARGRVVLKEKIINSSPLITIKFPEEKLSSGIYYANISSQGIPLVNKSFCVMR